MNNHLLILFALFLITSCANNTDNTHNTPPTNQITTQLRHVVMFKFKEAATSTDIKKVETAFASLPSKIKEIKDFEWGLNNSPEGLDKGFTHCFFVTFESEEERAVYLPYPAHMAFVDVIGPFIDDVLVLDYWAK